jgi:hypothetical protein
MFHDRNGTIILVAVPKRLSLVWEPAGADSDFFIGSWLGGFAALGEVGASVELVEAVES